MKDNVPYWGFNAVCVAFLAISIEYKTFGYLGLVFALASFIGILLLRAKKWQAISSRALGGMFSALLFWTPGLMFSVNPDLQYNNLIFSVLAISMVAGAFGMTVFVAYHGQFNFWQR